MGRIVRVGVLAAMLLAGHSLLAGGGGMGVNDPNAAQQEVFNNMDPELVQQFQQMDQVTDQILANMAKAGEDTRQFSDEINAHMSDGSLDVAAVEQDLITRGYMTSAQLTQINTLLGSMQVGMQQTVAKATYARIKQLLRPSEDEWAVLEPKVARVLDAQAVLTAPGDNVNLVLGIGGAMHEGPMSPGMYFISQLGAAAAADTELGRAHQALEAALADRQTSDATLAVRLRDWRTLHQKALAELKAGQDSLTSVVTLRQEAVLIVVGVL